MFRLEQELDDGNPIITTDIVETEDKQSSAVEVNPPAILTQKLYNGNDLPAGNNYTYADSLFDPQTFGYPSFFEDQFKATAGHQSHLSRSMLQMPTNDNCCNFDNLMGIFTNAFPCIEEYFVPEENFFC